MEDGVGVGDDGVVKNGIDIIYMLLIHTHHLGR